MVASILRVLFGFLILLFLVSAGVVTSKIEVLEYWFGFLFGTLLVNVFISSRRATGGK